MSETPARRTRASTRASATPAASGVGSRRRGKTPKPLPAVPTATSHAYGATGVVSLSTQLADSATDVGGFAKRFGADRGAAVSRDVEDGPSVPIPAVLPLASRSAKPPTAPPKAPPPSFKSPKAPPKAPALSVKAPPSTSTAVPLASSTTHLRKITKSSIFHGADHPITYHSATHRPSHHLTSHHHDDEDDEGEDEGEDEDDYEVEDGEGDEGEGEDSDLFAPMGGLSSFREHSVAGTSYTDLDTHFSYGGTMPPSSVPRRVASIRPPATTEETRAAEPWSLSVFLETVHRRFQDFNPHPKDWSEIIKHAVLASLAFLLLLLIFGPGTWSNMYEKGTGVLHTAGGYVTAPLTYLPTFSRRDHVVGGGLSERIITLETEIQHLRNEVGGLDVAELKKLQDVLPDLVVVRKNARTGHFDIPTHFWRALQAKLDNHGSGITWENFLESNGKKLDELSRDAVDKSFKNQHVITKDMLIDAIENKHTEFRKVFAKELLSLEESVRNSAESVARNTVTDIVEALPAGRGKTQLQSLALANIARNTDLAIRKVNYFSFNYGAYIDFSYTSPTHKRQQRGWFSRNVFDITRHGHPSPDWAINPWTEASECWCAAASDKFGGKAQLGVRMPRSIKPTSITIEHIPSSGTLDIAAAPKEFEVWVRNTSGKGKVLYNVNPHLGCGVAPSEGFVCVGKGRYDIKALNHVQNFELEEADEETGYVNQAVVKVLNNYGQDYTCLYRVRMHGDAEPTEVYRIAVDET